MNIKHGMNTTTPSERSEKEGLAPEPRELSSEELVELSSEELESIIGGVAVEATVGRATRDIELLLKQRSLMSLIELIVDER